MTNSILIIVPFLSEIIKKLIFDKMLSTSIDCDQLICIFINKEHFQNECPKSD